MRELVFGFLAVLSLFSSTTVAGQFIHPTFGPLSVSAVDTTVNIPFDLPAQPLGDALLAFSRQATIRVEVDRAALAGLWSRQVVGSHTPPEALRRLLDGSGLAVHFLDEGTARIRRAGADDLPIYSITPLTVIGERSRGYFTSRTATVTRTDTPLRDAPQAVTVVPHALIADQAMQGMADVVRYVPGIAMGQGEGHRDAPTIRGNSSTADFFVDGVRDDAQYLRDLYNVERVEALKGANAMTFGRGGGGGVLNRVSKEAQWAPARALVVEGGSFDHMRSTIDVGQGFGPSVAGRLNAMVERSDAFRDAVELRRWGVNPTMAVALGARTVLRAGYERFDDERTVDRGIPSYQGRPSPADRATFFGNPALSTSSVRVDAATAGVEHAARGGLTLRGRLRFADYDKFYQNSFPGAVNSAGTQVALSAYNQSIGRRNLFGQTDAVLDRRSGPVGHTLLLGAELGRQESASVRMTGYHNGDATSLTVPFAAPTIATPIAFRPSATDGDSEATASVASAYAQDQLSFGRHVQAILGVRWDRFGLDFRNRRSGQALSRTDDMVSPRAGLVLKPTDLASVYGAYSVSFLPGSGDQFSTLTVTSATLEPERFTNVEVGAKWDARPNLALTAAAYRLDRTKTSAPDPADPTRTVQTGEQRTRGVELGVAGSVTPAWQVAGGVAWQRAEIVSATAAARAGSRVPLVPSRSASLWNRVRLTPRFGVGLGLLHQTDMYAAISNTVILPAFTRVDGALFVRVHARLGAQVNVENLFDRRYFATSHGNDNILPGAPRTLRVSLTAG